MRPLPCCLPSGRRHRAGAGEKTGEAAGFTLVEVIVSLVLIGLLAALMSQGVGNIIQGYLFTRDNADTALKGQVALARIVKELRCVDGINSGSQTGLTYSYNRGGGSVGGRTLSWDGAGGSPLLLGGNTLVDDVADFSLTYYTSYNDAGDTTWDSGDTLIGITLSITGASDAVSSFSVRVAPRNL